ncbi:MAG: hypothetical protein V2I66_16445 [Halieaceae bacterium]|jgi:glyoxylase-like metal-dependent hydrolase (beta-lactamase superfamily II)|nr:hypothetical protein [Halieaceae bacterium]
MKTIIRGAMMALLLVTGAAQAQDDEFDVGALIDRVVAAYGGDALTGMRNYEIVEAYIGPNLGQSWAPELSDLNKNNLRFVHDIENGRAYFESYFKARGGIFPNLIIVNGEDALTVNLMINRHGEANSADPYTFGGGTMRTTDTLLARQLHAARDEAEYLGPTRWLNRPHEQVKMPFPLSPDLVLFIDAETHMVTRMTRENPQLGALDYVFDDHVEVDGIMAAKRVFFSVAGDPNLISTGRTVRFNRDLDDGLFERPAKTEPEGERIDTSEMVVNRLANNVYHIGQNGGYSIFVDTGTEVVGCGGYPGLRDRLAKFQEAIGAHKRLAYQVVTHHHNDHLGGIDEALSLGATLVTVDDTVEVIRDLSQLAPESGRFLTVNGRMTLGDGKDRVEIYDVSTVHSRSNLLFYVPATRTVFMADHFGSPYAEGVPAATRNTVSMAEALEPLELNYNRIVTAHNARVYTARDFERSVQSFRDFDCPDDRPLCSR